MGGGTSGARRGVSDLRRWAAATLLAGVACGDLPAGWLYVTRVGPTAATVVWTGPPEGAACRAAGGDTTSARATRGPGGVRSARLEGLRPGTRYVCRLSGPDGGARRARFRTAPVDAAPFTFAAVGDTGHGGRVAVALARRIAAAHPAFLIHLGDLAYDDGTADDFAAKFFRPFQPTLDRMPIFPTPGNHDLQRRSVYGELFAPTVPDGDAATGRYTFAWGPAHFVSIPTADAAAGAPGLAEELARLPPEVWRIVFLHEPLYTSGTKWTQDQLRKRFAPVLEEGRVDLVLAGHFHFYERSAPSCEYVPGRGVLNVTSGGGSGSLDTPRPHPNFVRAASVAQYVRVHVTPAWLDVRAVDLDGKPLDRFRWTRDAAHACRAAGWPKPRNRTWR